MGSESRTTSTLELTAGLKLSAEAKSKIHKEVGDFLVETTLSRVAKARSPIKGESFDPLSPTYKKHKVAEGGSGVPDLELSGEMLDSLTFEETDDGIELGHFDDQAAKADGHNNLSGKSSLPQRRYLPDVGDEYEPSVQVEIRKIIADALVEGVEIDTEDFSGVTTKADLYDVLEEYFPEFSRPAIKSAVVRNPQLSRLLDDLGVLNLL